MRLRVSLAAVATILAGGCLHPPGRHVEVGAVSVEVTDKATGRAVEGVPVAIAFRAWRLRGRFLWLVPSIEPIVGSKIVFRAKAVSGPDGRAFFAGQRMYLPGSEELAGLILFVNIALEPEDYRVAEDLKFIREWCKEEGKCTGVPDEIDVAVLEFGHEWDANSFLFRNPVEGYRGVILMRDAVGGKGEDWGRPKGAFRVENLESRPDLGGVYEARLLPSK